MSDDEEFSISRLHHKHQGENRPAPSTPEGNQIAPRPAASGGTIVTPPRPQSAGRLPFDPKRVWRVLRRHTGWALATGLVAGAGTFAAARHFLPYEATAQLMIRELPSLPASDGYKPQSLNSATLLGLLRSPDLFAAIATNIQPGRSLQELLANTGLHPNPDSDLLELTGKGPTPASAVELANQYARQAVSFTRERRRLEALELSDSLRDRLRAAGDRLEETNRRLLEFSRQHNVVEKGMGGRRR
jgi:uncharacterized protein involved in exopolysaccharide biosynthesis